MKKIFHSIIALSIALSIVFSPYSTIFEIEVARAALIDKVVSCWDLDESSGTRTDSVGSNDLTDGSSVGNTTGKVGNAADFVEASTDFLYITDASQSGLDLTGNISLAFWHNPTSIPQNTGGEFYHHLIDKWGGSGSRSYLLRYQNEGTPQYLFATSNNGTAVNALALYDTTLSTGTWYHIVVTYNSSTGAVAWYVNGTNVENDSTSSGSVFNSSQQFAIGGNAANIALDAAIDVVVVANDVFDSTDVSTLYASGSGIACSGLSAGATPLRGGFIWFQ